LMLRVFTLKSDLMVPVITDGELKYVYMPSISTELVMEPENVLHFRLLTWDGICGLSPLHYARDTFGLGIGAAKWQSLFFKNGVKTSFVLQHPGSLSAEAVERLKKAFRDLYSGIENAHGVPILEEGMEAKSISVNPRDAQVIELLNLNTKEVANIFGIPAHKLGDDTKTSYNSIEQENQAYLQGALDPIMKCIEEEMNIKLLSDEERESESHFIEFDRHSWLRADLTTQADYMNKALAGEAKAAKQAFGVEQLAMLKRQVIVDKLYSTKESLVIEK